MIFTNMKGSRVSQFIRHCWTINRSILVSFCFFGSSAFVSYPDRLLKIPIITLWNFSLKFSLGRLVWFATVHTYMYMHKRKSTRIHPKNQNLLEGIASLCHNFVVISLSKPIPNVQIECIMSVAKHMKQSNETSFAKTYYMYFPFQTLRLTVRIIIIYGDVTIDIFCCMCFWQSLNHQKIYLMRANNLARLPCLQLLRKAAPARWL